MIKLEEEFSELICDKTKIMKNLNYDLKMSHLNKENSKLREKFKELNDMLTILLDYKKMKSLRNYKAMPPLSKNVKKQRQGNATMVPKNLTNMEKNLQNIEFEYNYLKERKDKASNPEYLQKIINVNSKLSEEIKIMKKKVKLRTAEVKKIESVN